MDDIERKAAELRERRRLAYWASRAAPKERHRVHPGTLACGPCLASKDPAMRARAHLGPFVRVGAGEDGRSLYEHHGCPCRR